MKRNWVMLFSLLASCGRTATERDVLDSPTAGSPAAQVDPRPPSPCSAPRVGMLARRVLGPAAVSDRLGERERTIAVATDATAHAFLWIDGNERLIFQREHLTSVVASAARQPALVWNGIEYGAAFIDLAGARFVTLDSRGMAQGSPLVLGPLSTYIDDVALLWSGDSYLVFWTERANPRGRELRGQRLSARGVALTPVRSIASAIQYGQMKLSVAAAAGEVAVAGNPSDELNKHFLARVPIDLSSPGQVHRFLLGYSREMPFGSLVAASESSGWTYFGFGGGKWPRPDLTRVVVSGDGGVTTSVVAPGPAFTVADVSALRCGQTEVIARIDDDLTGKGGCWMDGDPDCAFPRVAVALLQPDGTLGKVQFSAEGSTGVARSPLLVRRPGSSSVDLVWLSRPNADAGVELVISEDIARCGCP
ncbi:MAG: hypothetical protein ACOZIN_05020 [Myxococcota bacterium]